MNLSAKLNKSDNLWPDELKILIVDDDQDMLNLVRLSLEPAGFRVLRTTKSDEGLDLALREMPDLLLLDIMMSGIDGLELLRRVRRHPKLTHIPAIIISAWANSPDQLRMLKPFELTTLLKTVKTVLIEHKDVLLEKNKPLQKPWEAKQATYH
jgi:CheY-like chemotaxis protein